MSIQPRDPDESEFDAITANLPDLAALAPRHDPQQEQDQPATPAASAPASVPASTSAEPEQHGAEGDLETQMRRDGYRPPGGPDDTHELPVSFKLRHAIKAGFGMTVLAAAVGQTLFFAGFFGGGLAGYGLAVLIAAFAEVTMIGSGDAALRHKVEGNQGWQLLLAVSALVAVGATVMQVAHWSAENQPVMALTFGAASLLGWIVHITSGLITAAGYLARRHEWDAELARRRRKREARADAAHERHLAEWQTQRQATRRAVAEVEPPAADPATPEPAGPEPATQAKPAAPKPQGAGRTKPATPGLPEPDPDEVFAWSAANNHPGPTPVKAEFDGRGYKPMSTKWFQRAVNDRKPKPEN